MYFRRGVQKVFVTEEVINFRAFEYLVSWAILKVAAVDSFRKFHTSAIGFTVDCEGCKPIGGFRGGICNPSFWGSEVDGRIPAAEHHNLACAY